MFQSDWPTHVSPQALISGEELSNDKTIKSLLVDKTSVGGHRKALADVKKLHICF
jgi:hypothetical protein